MNIEDIKDFKAAVQFNHMTAGGFTVTHDGGANLILTQLNPHLPDLLPIYTTAEHHQQPFDVVVYDKFDIRIGAFRDCMIQSAGLGADKEKELIKYSARLIWRIWEWNIGAFPIPESEQCNVTIQDGNATYYCRRDRGHLVGKHRDVRGCEW